MSVKLRPPPTLQKPAGQFRPGSAQTLAPRPALYPTARYLPPPDIDPFAVEAEAPDPNPYVDYSRALTAEGGILFRYKDLDERFRHKLWRWFAWTVATGPEGYFLFHGSPAHHYLTTILAFALLAWVNWRILDQPVQVYRRLEIRPDCMIVEDTDVFWRDMMEIALPRFSESTAGHQVLSGVYGTRFIEYLTVRKFDALDRTPEVFASNLTSAMREVWGNASLTG